MKHDVIVIGAGVNGLTSAAYLARGGRTVLVLEQRATTGGICSTEEFFPGFRANTCVDDIGWMPSSVMRDLGLTGFGALAPVSMTIPVAGAAPIVITPDIAATSASLRRHSPNDAAKWPEFCAFVTQLCGFLETLYGVRAPAVESNAPADLMTLLSLGKKLRGLGRRGMIDLIRTIPMPVADVLDEWFESDALKGALSTIGVRNVQHGPQSGGTALVFLHNHVGLPLGAIGGRRIATGGVGSLPTALDAIVTKAGGTIRTGAEVVRIRVRDDRVTGVVLASGEEIEASVVVSSADVRRTFATLCDAGDFDPEFLHAVDCVRMRGPQVRVHLALAQEPTCGEITVAPSMSYVEKTYDAAKHGRIADQPWLRVSTPSIGDSSFAPAGKHVISVQVQCAPYRLRAGWTTEARVSIGENVMKMLDAHSPGLLASVMHYEVVAPPDVETRFAVTEGSLLHGELALDQFLFARPVASASRYASPVAGLWMCGSGTHPGAGTAGVSGRLAAREILGSRP
jgi:phytoene dehydrogenase-like protein